MNGSGYAGMTFALAAVLALLAVAIVVLKRFRSFSARSDSRVPLRLVKKVALGPKQGVGLLRVGDRILVISLGDGGTRLLAELEGADLAEALEDTEAAAKPRRSPGRALVKRVLPFLALLALTLSFVAPLPAAYAQAAPGAPATVAGPVSDNPFLSPAGPQVDITMGQGKDALRLSGAVGLVVFIGFLTLLPAVLLLMTSFTRILVVLQFLRPALGTQHAPPLQLIAALALLLSGVVMHPVLEKTNEVALQPYLHGEITQAEAYKLGIQPFRDFMLANTSEKDLAFFVDLTGADDQLQSLDEIPTLTLVSSFVTSELRTAFQMGFLIFVPFIVVDLIVASVLMSLGMFMLPPMMVSLPFKLLLFVLADGWTLVIKNLVLSFR